jgi:hypothetical protein
MQNRRLADPSRPFRQESSRLEPSHTLHRHFIFSIEKECANVNLTISDRHLSVVPRDAWQLVVDQGSFAQQNVAAGISAATFLGETHHDAEKRRERDSNPRSGLSRLQHFQCCSFGHSDISPAHKQHLTDESGNFQLRWNETKNLEDLRS